MNHPLPRPQYWPYSTSDMDCSVSGRYPPDSAYYTKSPATQSLFSGDIPASSQQSLTGAMNAMELPNEQMSYMFLPNEPFQRLSQEVPCSSAERPYAEHQTENSVEWFCDECETRQTFKNKSEYKYVQA